MLVSDPDARPDRRSPAGPQRNFPPFQGQSRETVNCFVHERIEKAGGASSDYPSVLERLGVTAAMWESAVQVTSRRFARELDIMAMMFAEARRRS